MDSDVKTVLDKLELVEGNYLLNAGAALFCDCGIVNELQIAKFASDERLTFTDIRRYSGSVMELKKKAEQYIIDAMDWRVEFATGLKRIKDACDKAGCRVEFETPDDGFVVVFYQLLYKLFHLFN